MFGAFKDSAAKVAANRLPQVQRFGTVHSVRIDAEKRQVELEIGLKGEPAPIGFTLLYALEERDGHTRVKVESVSCSRGWLQEAIALWLSRHEAVGVSLDGLAAQLVRFLL